MKHMTMVTKPKLVVAIWEIKGHEEWIGMAK
jgi:hypothetical protein